METTHEQLRRQAIQFLRGLQQAGVTDLPAETARSLGAFLAEPPSESVGEERAKFSPAEEAGPEKPAATRESQADAPADAPRSEKNVDSFSLSDPYGPPSALPARRAALDLLNQQVAACDRCSELSSCRTQTVFGTGNPLPRLAFYGEGPGADEDRQGEPFVGRAGELLNKIIQACKMKREDVYIFNTVKCRPPGNRNPREEEISNCWQYSEQQLEVLQPEFICCLVSVAARTLLKTTESVGRLRGKFHQYRGSRVIVTYHPAYLLRTPEAKAKTWDDMKMLMAAMGIEL